MRCGFYLAALFVLCAAPAFADPKKEAAPDDKKPEAEKLLSLGQVAGVLTNTGGSEANYTIRVTLRVVQPNPQAEVELLRKNQQLIQRQAQIMNNRNPWQRQQQLAQLVRDAQQAPANLFTVKDVPQDVRAVPADDMKVRLAQPPPAFDDKGNIKKYTAKELKELKGPDNLPGYTGTMDDVKANQLVVVYLARKPAKAGDKAKDGEKTKDGDKLLDKDNPLVIRMIVVLGDKK
jgi:hypothetical protein